MWHMAEPPTLHINGADITPDGVIDAHAPVAALADLDIKWGAETITAPPAPATLTATVRYRGAVDTLELRQGDLVEVKQSHSGRTLSAFYGRIRNMSASTDARGRLNVRFTATDVLADLDNTYVSTAWPADRSPEASGVLYVNRLREAISAAGWSFTGFEDMPLELGPSGATYYNSIKLTTLLSRYLAQWGPQAKFWDASRTTADGSVVRRLRLGRMGALARGDRLLIDPNGTWFLVYGRPDGVLYVTVPASNVYRDIEWESTPENLVSAARIGYHQTRKEENAEGQIQLVTSTDFTNVSRGPGWDEERGPRAIEVVTSQRHDNLAAHRTIGEQWMNFNGDHWRAGSVQLHDSEQLTTEALGDMVDKETRPRQWIVIPGIHVPTPRGNLATLRGLATGGTLTWNGTTSKWDISVHLTDVTLMVEDPEWTFADLAADPSPDISGARATNAGAVQFSNFRTIATLEGSTT